MLTTPQRIAATVTKLMESSQKQTRSLKGSRGIARNLPFRHDGPMVVGARRFHSRHGTSHTRRALVIADPRLQLSAQGGWFARLIMGISSTLGIYEFIPLSFFFVVVWKVLRTTDEYVSLVGGWAFDLIIPYQYISGSRPFYWRRIFGIA